MFAPSMVPMMRQPFIWNFMLEVPLASVPAVLMCCDSSDAEQRAGVNKQQENRATTKAASAVVHLHGDCIIRSKL